MVENNVPKPEGEWTGFVPPVLQLQLVFLKKARQQVPQDISFFTCATSVEHPKSIPFLEFNP